jgi:diguanylate cyclase
MNYQDSIEQSAELLRRALPLMSKQKAALNPISYAVWYEYVAGINPALQARIDELTRDGGLLDDDVTVELFRKYVSEVDAETAQRVSQDMQRVMTDMSRSAAQAGENAGQFGNALKKLTDELADTGDASASKAGIAMLLTQTQEMQQSVAKLKLRLDDSQQEIESLKLEVVRAREAALIDGLTGLTNRKGFDKAIEGGLEASMDPKAYPSLIMADIDFFKRINDEYGHVFGDRVIQAVARVLKDSVKGRDTAARYGGEEFAILLPDTPIEGAVALAEQIRSQVSRCHIKRQGNHELIGNITISMGVARYDGAESVASLVARADRALYVSKQQGRNRVTAEPAPAG